MEMVKAIRETGRTPVQRDTFYAPIKVWEELAPSTEAETDSRSGVLEKNLATG
jgi:hypothetical protein